MSNLRASLDEKAFNYEIEARKTAPDQRLGYADGGWYGHGMG